MDTEKRRLFSFTASGTAAGSAHTAQWEFDTNGLMRRREGSINDVPIRGSDRKFHWLAGPHPADHGGLTELGF